MFKELYKLCGLLRAPPSPRFFCGVVQTIRNCPNSVESRSDDDYVPRGTCQHLPPPWPLFKVNYCFPDWIALHFLALGLFSLVFNAFLIFVIYFLALGLFILFCSAVLIFVICHEIDVSG